MSSTTRYNQGDVVLLPFPFTDLTVAKQRPAVVISPERYHGEHADLIVLAITSHVAGRDSYDYLLSPEEQQAAGLPKPSLVKVGKVPTIEETLVRKKLGTLPSESTRRLVRKFLDLFVS